MRCRVGVREKRTDGVDRKVLKWFGYVERMSGDLKRFTKRVYESEVEGLRYIDVNLVRGV